MLCSPFDTFLQMEKYVIDLDKVLDELELCDNGKLLLACSSNDNY